MTWRSPLALARRCGLAFLAAIISSACGKPVPFPADVARAEIRHLGADASSSRPSALVGTDRLVSGALLDAFYRPRDFEPAWSREGELTPDAAVLVSAVERADEDGLRPRDYHHERLVSLLRAAGRPRAPEENLRARARLLGHLDALLTDAFLLYAAHLSQGKVSPERMEPRWSFAAQQPGLTRVLASALATHTVADTLRRLVPDHAYYRGLRAARARWQTEAAAPGRKGAAAARRVAAIDVNLERWRWMPRDLGRAHVLVDVAAFELAIVDEGRPLDRMKIVAGSEAWQTPDFSSRIDEIVLNPSWNAPRHVLVTELINYMRADPNYLASNKMTLLRPVDGHEEPVDPATIDFAAASAETIDFRLRQAPGPLNVLGRLMFRLPNKFDIFLHDTPYQEDFGKPSRMYSHGCIRVERPMDLALFLLRGDRAWTRERLVSTIDTVQEQVITLRRPVATHVVYLTAWADADGRVRQTTDVYQRDQKLEVALRAVGPRAGPDRGQPGL
jgi:murein L,D-transpeptidase YcbB/YkuD